MMENIKSPIKQDYKLTFPRNCGLKFLFIFPFFIFLIVILLFAILSPYFETHLMVKEYQLTNSILGKICHQFPSRCFYIFDSNMGLCARCFSIYFGMLILCSFSIFIETSINLKNCFIIGLSLIIPLILDGVTQYLTIRESDNFLRLFTGISAGAGIAIIFFPIYFKIVSKFAEKMFTIITVKGDFDYVKNKK